VCVRVLQEDVGNILILGRGSREQYCCRIVWQRLRMGQGGKEGNQCPKDSCDVVTHGVSCPVKRSIIGCRCPSYSITLSSSSARPPIPLLNADRRGALPEISKPRNSVPLAIHVEASVAEDLHRGRGNAVTTKWTVKEDLPPVRKLVNTRHTDPASKICQGVFDQSRRDSMIFAGSEDAPMLIAASRMVAMVMEAKQHVRLACETMFLI
jgi:hypothetical protein